MRRPNPKVALGGKPQVWIGVNFWSAAGGPLMWRSYDPDRVSRELDNLDRHGMATTRSFLYWPDFQPTPDTIDDALVARFRDFLNKHDVRGMKTIPTFIVGHMSGQNWDPAWRGGRDFFSDVWFVARQAFYVRELVARLHDHPAIAGWLLTNEVPIYADWRGRGAGADPDVVASWARILVDAVRAGGGGQPVGIGDGVFGVDTSGADNGFRERDLSPLTDFIGPHVYRMETDQIRQHMGAGFVVDLLHRDGKPVIVEEFGLSSDYSSDAHAADYYRQLLHHSLLAGATGWLAWNNTDFDDLANQAPYTHRPFELHFGLFDKDGRPKPAAGEIRAFRDLVSSIDLARCSRPDSRIALVASSFFDNQYPFTEVGDGPTIVATLRQAYVAAREADLPVTVVRESDAVAWTPGSAGDLQRGAPRGSNLYGREASALDPDVPLDDPVPLGPGQPDPADPGPGLPADAALYIVPSTKALTSPTWVQLAELVRGGATVYASYFAGTHTNQRGAWWPTMHELFGVRKETRYGLVDPIEDDVLDLTFMLDLGDIAAGTTLRFSVAGNANSRCYLPVTPDGAEVVAVDGRRRPALLRNRVGSGQSVLCTYPVEYMAAETPAVNPEDTWRLYRALAVEAGVSPEETVDTGAVSVGRMVHEDGRRFVWFINLTKESVTVTPRMSGTGPLVPLGGQGSVTSVSLGPYGVEVLERR